MSDVNLRMLEEVRERVLSTESQVAGVRESLARIEAAVCERRRWEERTDARLGDVEGEVRDIPDIRRRMDKHGEYHAGHFEKIEDLHQSRARLVGIWLGAAAVGGGFSALVQMIVGGTP